jgi:hypothetical protein
LRVFVSSTLGELAEERRAVKRAISAGAELNRRAAAAVRNRLGAGTRAS